MRTTESRATFLANSIVSSLRSVLAASLRRGGALTGTLLNRHALLATCIVLLATASASITPVSAQVPPKIPGLPVFGKPAAAAEVVFADSRDQVEVRAQIAHANVAPGGDVPIAIEFELLKGWHIWPAEGVSKLGPNAEELAEFDGAIRTEITVKPGAVIDPRVQLNLTFIQWPALHAATADLGDGPKQFGVYEGHVAAFIPASIASNAAAGTVEIPLLVSFQACNDTGCSAPADVELMVRIEIAAATTTAAPSAMFQAFDPTVYRAIRSGATTSKVIEFNLLAYKFSIDPTGWGFVALLLIAALGGALLNFTPCVLPVIPLKIMGLAQAAQGSRARCFALGVVMSLGVVAFWMVLGSLMAFVQGFSSANQLFQMPWFTILVGVIIGAMAIGMAGMFTISLPNWVYHPQPNHDSYIGSFSFGVMTAVLSTPCTAPLMGTAVAWSTTEGAGTILTVFGAVGAGMALPYLVLSAFPSLVESMPRTGKASDLIKQVMGLLLLAASAYFIGAGLSGVMVEPPTPPSKMYWWSVAAFGFAAGAWLLLRTMIITQKSLNRVVFGGFALVMLAISLLIGISQTAKGPVDWIYYTPQRLASAQSEGKVVVVDFTAEWCANCKTFEALVLNLPRVARELNADDVAAIKVDLTGNNSEGNALLKASHRVTIPLLLVYGRDGSLILNASDYTPQQVIDAINAARNASSNAAPALGE